jgi:branched-chain amino acid transport system ATP-binding protein
MLKLRNLRAGYGRIEALHGVSVHVREGEIVALIGANGAGKTTLLNTISGVVRAGGGSIEFGGEELIGMRPEQIVRRGVCQVPEGRQVFSRHTVQENLELGAYLRYRAEGRQEVAADLERMFQRFPVLGERRRQAAWSLSGGEQQMLAMARALMARPRLLLLDEPSMGLAPRLVAAIFEIITGLRKEGATILLVEQNARAALQIADRGYVLEVGRVALEGEAGELLEDPEVKRAYLGRDYKEVWER